MRSWIVIIVVCLIYGIIMDPIQKAINKRVGKKWLAYIIVFGIAIAVLTVLYTLADILGFAI